MSEFPIGAELAVQFGPITHVGIYVGEGMVFHADFFRGQELISLARFAGKRKVTLRAEGIDCPNAFKQRLEKALATPKRYNLFAANCEHTSYTLRTGKAKSPQMRAWSVVAGLTTAAIAYNQLKRSDKPPKA